MSSVCFVESKVCILIQSGDSHTEAKALCAREGDSECSSKRTSSSASLLAESTDDELDEEPVLA